MAILFWLASIGWSICNRWHRAGTTRQLPGKKALNLRLVSEVTGQPIGVQMALTDEIVRSVVIPATGSWREYLRDFIS